MLASRETTRWPSPEALAAKSFSTKKDFEDVYAEGAKGADV